jgi:hypothetical protein
LLAKGVSSASFPRRIGKLALLTPFAYARSLFLYFRRRFPRGMRAPFTLAPPEAFTVA